MVQLVHSTLMLRTRARNSGMLSPTMVWGLPATPAMPLMKATSLLYWASVRNGARGSGPVSHRRALRHGQ